VFARLCAPVFLCHSLKWGGPCTAASCLGQAPPGCVKGSCVYGFVYVRECMHVRVCIVCARMCVNVCMCVCVCVCTYVCMYLCEWVRTSLTKNAYCVCCACVCVCECECVYVFACVCMTKASILYNLLCPSLPPFFRRQCKTAASTAQTYT